MPVEIALYPTQLNTALPASSNFVSEGDDHLRLVKTVMKTTFPNLGGAWNATQTEANYLVGVTSAIQAQLDSKGAITGQTWTGTHVFPSTTTIGGLTPTIRGYLETVTSDAQAQLNARALKAGDTYSGTHNFTGATVRVPTLAPGATGDGAASVDFANALAFASALPGQSGNARKVVTTNGASASWTDAITLSSLNGGQLAGMRNKIINGKMEIAQRGTSFAAIVNGAFTIDRWKVITSSAGVCTVSLQADIPSGNEFQSSLRVAVTTADASVAAGDRFELLQVAEGFNVRDLIGRTFTLSFWVRSSKTGVHCVSLGNSGGDRSYIAEYTVNASNTWEQKSITVSGGLITAGTWDWTSGWGLGVRFTLMAGSSVQTTANAWQTGDFTATSSQVNCLDTIGNIFAITGVQLEVGSVATPFEHRPYGVELALCHRYYYRLTNSATNTAYIGLLGGVSSTRAIGSAVTTPQPMRSTVSQLEYSGLTLHAMSSTSVGAVATAAAYGDLKGPTHSLDLTVSSGLTSNTPYMLGVGQNGFIGFSAEL